MKYGRFILAIVLLQMCQAIAWGDEFRLVPSIAVREDYNSNVLFSTAGAQSDFITTVSPGLEMVDSTGRMDTDLNIRLDLLDYARLHYLNSWSQSYNGSFGYRLTPVLGFTAAAGYTRTTNPTLNVVYTTTGVTSVAYDNYTGSLSTNYQLTEKTAAVVSYVYQAVHYDVQGYSAESTHDFNALATYDLGKYVSALKGRMVLDYNLIYYPGLTFGTATGTLGFSRDVSEKWNLRVDGGARNTWSELDETAFGFENINGQFFLVPVTYQISNNEWDWVMHAAFNYTGLKNSGSVTYDRDVVAGIGTNTAVARNSAGISTQHRFTQEFSGTFSTAYSTLDPLGFESPTSKQQVFVISPGIHYEFSKDVAMDASYQFSLVRYPLTNTEGTRHVFSIRLYAQRFFFE